MNMNSTTEQMQRTKSCNSEFHVVTVNPVHLSADMDFALHIFYIPPKIGEAIFFYRAFIMFYKYLYHCRTISLTDEKNERFHSRDQHLCKLTGTKKSVIKYEKIATPTGLV